MESRAKILGHPLHQMLIVFPLGLLATAVVFDLVGAFGGYPDFSIAAYWMILAGVISGLVAAVPGLIDLLSIPRHTRAWSVGLLHGLGNVAVLALFTISWILRVEPAAPGSIPIVLGVIAAGISGFTGWLGGELVDRLGVGVHDGAHLDSPSSLSGRSAAEHHRARVPGKLRPPRPRTVEP